MRPGNARKIFDPSLFWDAEDIDLDKHAGYVISRVLDFGNEQDVKAILEIYGKEEIIRVIKSRKGLLPKTGKYWAIKFNIPVREVACLKKYYQKKQ